MEYLSPILVKEKEEKKVVFEDIQKWIDLEIKYSKIRNEEIKKQEEFVCNLHQLSREHYNSAMSSLMENEAGMDLVHFVFWTSFFEYNEKVSLDQGRQKTKIDIPAGELVDFYVWRENAIKKKFEMKLFKKCFTKEICSHVVRERIKNYVEMHRKRPYEQYAILIWRNPTYVIKSTGSHKKRFEQEMNHIFLNYHKADSVKDYKKLLTKHSLETKQHCCTIF